MTSVAQQVVASFFELSDSEFEGLKKQKFSFRTMAEIYFDEMKKVLVECQKFEEVLSRLGKNPLKECRDRHGFSMCGNSWVNAYRNLSHKGGPTTEQRSAASSDLEHGKLSHVKDAEFVTLMIRVLGKVEELEEGFFNSLIQNSKMAPDEEGISPYSFSSRGNLTESHSSQNSGDNFVGERSKPIPVKIKVYEDKKAYFFS